MSRNFRAGLRPGVLLVSFSLLTAGVVLAPTALRADEYSVQIGAFRELPSGYAEAASAVGPLMTTTTREGITRFQIGRFESAEAARTALSALIGAGYADAFVVQKRVALNETGSATGETAQWSTPEKQTPSTTRKSAAPDPLAGVPESLRSRIVSLDGAYHVKEGDRFIPLDEALAREN